MPHPPAPRLRFILYSESLAPEGCLGADALPVTLRTDPLAVDENYSEMNGGWRQRLEQVTML